MNKFLGVVDRIENNFFVVRCSGKEILIEKGMSPNLIEGDSLVITIKKKDNIREKSKNKGLIFEIFKNEKNYKK